MSAGVGASRRGALPGFGLSLGISLAAVTAVVVLPVLALFLSAVGFSPQQMWAAATEPRSWAAYRLSFGASLLAAGLNGVFGLLVAWVLVRYRFWAKGWVDALVDLPFALPTAVAGLTLTALYAKNGALGRVLEPLGIHVAFTRLGVVLALTFVGLPFVVRTVEPVLAQLDPALEEAAATLGASRAQTFVRVVLPALGPALLSGVTLAFARALGEYGSIVFISGNMPGQTEIVPLLIVTRLEQYDTGGATALALVMLTASFLLLLLSNFWQRNASVSRG